MRLIGIVFVFSSTAAHSEATRSLTWGPTLRQAAATARNVLIDMTANKWNVDRQNCVLMIDFKDDKLLNGRLSKYRVPRFPVVPDLDVVLLNRKDLPSAGAGETPSCV